MRLAPAVVAAAAVAVCWLPGPGPAAGAELDLTVVQTSEGALRGHMMTSFGGRLFIAFRGVPYARPPVGVLRFRPPEPPVPWAGIRSAKYEGSVCPQLLVTTDMFAGDEDCLYLNVYTHKDANKVPVLVWLHGGGFHAGDGGIEENGPEYLMDQNLVLVTLNHRLGVLGFLSTGDAELPGNYGLKDQVMALQWVQRNVAEFGGDPSRVTLYGAGSGAACAQYHMLSPLSAGLFHRVIAQSGSVLNPWALQRTPLQNAQKLASLVGCSSFETSLQVRHCLSAAPAEQLVSTLYHFPHWAVRFPIPWAPVVERQGDRSAFLPDEPENRLRDGRVNYVPLIAGSSLDEHAALAALVESRPDLKSELLNDFDGVIRRALHLHHIRSGLLRRLHDFYLGPVATVKEVDHQALIDLFSDGMYTHGVIRAARLLASSSPAPVYYYVFSFAGRGDYYSSDRHVDDVGYVLREKIPFPGNRPSEGELTRLQRLGMMLANFAASGNPTPTKSELLPEPWRPLARDGSVVFYVIGDNVTLKSAPPFFLKRMHLWDSICFSDEREEL